MPRTTKVGRRRPLDEKHLRAYPYKAAAPKDAESQWPIPAWAATWNQRHLDACVGFATSMCLSLANEASAWLHKNPPYRRVYDAVGLWWAARLTDEFADNDDLKDTAQGTTVRAAMEILRTVGPKLIERGVAQPPDLGQGIREYRWGATLDHLRAAVAKKEPVVLGIDGWQGLGEPVKVGNELWVGDGIPGWKRGLFAGEHAMAVAGISDSREGILFQNSWGTPAFWMTYKHFENDLASDSYTEIAIMTDKPTP